MNAISKKDQKTGETVDTRIKTGITDDNISLHFARTSMNYTDRVPMGTS